jgi:hypothetical protein
MIHQARFTHFKSALDPSTGADNGRWPATADPVDPAAVKNSTSPGSQLGGSAAAGAGKPASAAANNSSLSVPSLSDMRPAALASLPDGAAGSSFLMRNSVTTFLVAASRAIQAHSSSSEFISANQ